MAIDRTPAAPSPEWDTFAAAHDDDPVYVPAVPTPRTGHGPAASLPDLDVDAMVRLVTQAQAVQAATLATEKSRVPAWARGEHAKTAAWSVLVPTLVTGCANLAAHQWGSGGAVIVSTLVSGLTAGLGIYGQGHHWSPQASGLMLGVFLGSVSFAVSAGGSGWTDVAAWLVAAAGTVGYKIVWNRKHAADKASIDLTMAKVRTENFKGDAVRSASALKDAFLLLKIQEEQRAQAAAGQGPDLSGDTLEEREIRRAVWDVFGVELYSCDVRPTLTGWIATVGLPVALPRSQAKTGWDKVSSALRADGRFVVADGRLTNEIAVKFLDRTKVNTSPMPWSPDVIPTDPKASMSLGVNTETGDPVLLQYDERLLICGASGTGKSWAARPLLAHAHLNGDLVVADGKGEEANVLGEVCRVAVEQGEIEQLIDAVHAEMNRRKAVMAERGLSVWDGTQLTFFIDEGQVVLAMVGKDKDRMQRLIELSSLGRSRGVVLWWSTQKPVMSGDSAGVHSLIAPNLLQRFSLRVATEQEARTALDGYASYGPHAISDDRSMRGHGYLAGYGPSLLRTWTMDDDAVRSLPRKVWRGESEATPEEKVAAYLAANPTASQREVADATGVARTTVQRAMKTL